MTLSPRTIRFDLKCGKSGISPGEKCHKGTATQKAVTAGSAGRAVGIVAAGVGIGAIALGKVSMRSRGRRAVSTPGRSSPPPSSGPSTPRVELPKMQPRLTGVTPRALLPPAAPRRSKTQRMRENTRAAMQVAEARIAQTTREEVRRVAQIGNTMAATGEATGMAMKTTLRELRLRTEAARRRFEPGYRTTKASAPKTPAQLPEGGTTAFQAPFSPSTPRTPERINLDPRTGQPRRKKARGFGQRRDTSVSFYPTTYVDPARQ